MMKTLFKWIFALSLIVAVTTSSYAQETKNAKRAAEEAAVKKIINNRNYKFKANYMYPQGGGQRYLTTDYDLKIGKDTVFSFLPYFGVAYFGAGYNNSSDAGIKFTSTEFDYQTTTTKKGGWNIIIKPKDAGYTSQLILSISPNGFSSLTVISTNRQSIRFDGFIKENKKNN